MAGGHRPRIRRPLVEHVRNCIPISRCWRIRPDRHGLPLLAGPTPPFRIFGAHLPQADRCGDRWRRRTRSRLYHSLHCSSPTGIDRTLARRIRQSGDASIFSHSPILGDTGLRPDVQSGPGRRSPRWSGRHPHRLCWPHRSEVHAARGISAVGDGRAVERTNWRTPFPAKGAKSMGPLCVGHGRVAGPRSMGGQRRKHSTNMDAPRGRDAHRRKPLILGSDPPGPHRLRRVAAHSVQPGQCSTHRIHHVDSRSTRVGRPRWTGLARVSARRSRRAGNRWHNASLVHRTQRTDRIGLVREPRDW